MVYLSSSDEWQQRTSQLLQARPTTTRITSHYKVPNLDTPKYQKPKKRKRDGDGENKDTSTAETPKLPRATLTLKTYDPESGVTLKFKTDRAAEVGRLISGLGRVGRYMAALPEKEEAPEIAMEDAPAVEQVAETATKDTADPKPQAGGGGKKKKKNKK